MTLSNIVLAGRPPGASNTGGPYEDFRPFSGTITVAAGQTYPINAAQTFGLTAPVGGWYCYLTYRTTDGRWHHDTRNAALQVTGGTSGSKSQLRPIGTAILTDAEAAAKVRRVAENRPDNATANRTVPSAQQLQSFRAATPKGNHRYNDLLSRVTGDFTGTTDELIQWTSWKWGLPEDWVRAQAVQESTWRQSVVGDAGLSFGLLQIKRTAHPGTFPMSRDSTPFNLDYFGMRMRASLDGGTPGLGCDRPGNYDFALAVWFNWCSYSSSYVSGVHSWYNQRASKRPGF